MDKLKSLLKAVPQILIGVAVILVSIIISWLMIFSGGSVPKTEIEIKPTLVETTIVKKVSQNVNVIAYGEVKAKRSLTISPEVGGRVIELSPKFIDGGLLNKGDVILRIDPRDYITAVEQQKALVKKAEFEFKLEVGRQVVAKREWGLLGESIQASDVSKDLALRKPQLEDKQAAFDAAKSQLAKAELDLKRTVILAPFNAVVTSEDVEIGQIVSPQTQLGKVVSTGIFEVLVSVPFDKLGWIEIPRINNKGSKAIISQELGSGKRVQWEGEVLRLLGDVDPSGRMARIKVGIPDPLGLEDENREDMPLLLGTYVRVKIEGPTVENIFILPREMVREGSRVWVKTPDNKLEIRKVNTIYKLPESIVIDEGLETGDEVIISNIPVPIPGMAVRTEEKEPLMEQENEEEVEADE